MAALACDLAAAGALETATAVAATRGVTAGSSAAFGEEIRGPGSSTAAADGAETGAAEAEDDGVEAGGTGVGKIPGSVDCLGRKAGTAGASSTFGC